MTPHSGSKPMKNVTVALRPDVLQVIQESAEIVDRSDLELRLIFKKMLP